MSRPLTIPTSVGSFDAITAGPADGRPVLLLHGFPETAIAWDHQVAALGERGFRAVAPDLRGYSAGVRPQEPSAYGVSELVGDVLAMTDGLGWGSFDLVGHDWGGAVAWWTAARHPERLRTLTAVSTPHPTAWAQALRSDDEQQRRTRHMEDWRDPDTEGRLLANDAEMLRGLYEGKIPASHVEEYVRRLSEPGALSAALNYYRADRPDWEVAKIEVPTLFVWSTEDRIGLAPALATEDWVSADYTFHKFEGVTHWIFEEVPEVFTALLLDHLDGR